METCEKILTLLKGCSDSEETTKDIQEMYEILDRAALENETQ